METTVRVEAERIVKNAEQDAQRLSERVSHLEADLEHARAELHKVQAFQEMFHRYGGGGGQGNGEASGGAIDARWSHMKLSDAVADILRMHGGQAKMTDVIDLLQKAGRRGKRQSLYGSLVQTLQRDPERFEKLKPGLWALMEQKTLSSAEQSAGVGSSNGTG